MAEPDRPCSAAARGRRARLRARQTPFAAPTANLTATYGFTLREAEPAKFLKLASSAVAASALRTAVVFGAPRFDMVLRGGLLLDGTGLAAYPADVAIDGDRTAAIGTIAPEQGRRVLDVGGIHVCPGFIQTDEVEKGTVGADIAPDRLRAVLEWLRCDAEGPLKPETGRRCSNEVGDPVKYFRSAQVGALIRAGIAPSVYVRAEHPELSEPLRWHDPEGSGEPRPASQRSAGSDLLASLWRTWRDPPPPRTHASPEVGLPTVARFPCR